MGFELFDKPNWSGSDFSEKVNYQRALEAELERTIQTMNGVEAVRVHLVLPHESLFTERERPAKAAVVLKLRGMRLSDDVAGSIANLVSSAWDDLSPQNVSVITTDGQMPAQHGSLGGNSGGSGGNVDLETAMAERVVQVLSPIVGADHVKTSVTIEYDPTSGESTQDLYDPNSTAVLSAQVSQETAQGLDTSGIPGTSSNAPNAPPSGAAANQTNTGQTAQGIHTENKTFAVSHTTRHIIEPAGRFKRIAAAVLVDDVVDTKIVGGKPVEARRRHTPEEMKQIEDLAKAALGWDATRGDQISVQNVTFQTTPVEKPEEPPVIDRVRVIAEHWTGLFRYAALFGLFVLVYFLILNPVKKQVLATLQAQPVAALPGKGAQALGGGAGALGNDQGLLEETAVANPQFNRALALKQQIVSNVKTDPENAGRLVKDWLQESGAR
jgi:flagellar M-ring protein FliF